MFNNLMQLCDNEAFFFIDQEYKGAMYRIFNYRLASYTNFLLPSALECRGITFRITDGVGIECEPELVCRPMCKFFNLGENPFTMNLNLSEDNIDSIEMKADGSLISSYMDVYRNVALKSKGSLSSEQAQSALKVLEKDEKFYNDVSALTACGYTVNMELVAPYNRIVLNYQHEQLIVLNIRSNATGELMDTTDPEFAKTYPSIYKRMTQQASELYDIPYSQLIEQVKDLKDIEGFVVYLKDDTVFKLKTEWYLTLHRNKDNVDTPRRLFEAAIYEATDDLRSLFNDNPYVINKIEQMEIFAAGIYNHLVSSVENFVSVNRVLIDNDQRKDFAILAKNTLEPHMMGLAMGKYDEIRGIKGGVDFKQYVVKNWKQWGLRDFKCDTEQ